MQIPNSVKLSKGTSLREGPGFGKPLRGLKYSRALVLPPSRMNRGQKMPTTLEALYTQHLALYQIR